MHIHLDPLGGIAGDMFLAAVFDAWPELAEGAIAAARAAGLPPAVAMATTAHTDHALAGTRLRVDTGNGTPPAPPGRFAAIAERLAAAPLSPPVRGRALAIFAVLAEAEARVHGIAAADVVFHELAGWDSIADVVGAAHVIEALGATGWSVGPLPLGAGRIATAHGPLPVPAPATAVLLEGFPVIDDGIGGERVTPTGAAILRHLAAAPGLPHEPLRLSRCGIGFGTRTLPGISNVLRLMGFEGDAGAPAVEAVGVIAFEVDDQTPEDLATGLDALRARDDVLDVVQIPSSPTRITCAIRSTGASIARPICTARSHPGPPVRRSCRARTSTTWAIIARACAPPPTTVCATCLSRRRSTRRRCGRLPVRSASPMWPRCRRRRACRAASKRARQ